MGDLQKVPAQKAHAVQMIADRLNVGGKELADVVQKTCLPSGHTHEDFVAFMIIANEHRLNPLTRQIYAFKGKGGGIVPIVSVDGWAHIVNSHPQLDWFDWEDVVFKDGKPFSSTCIIKRKDRGKPTRKTAYFSEYFQPSSEPWKKTPTRMLEHKSFILCARFAFGISNLWDPDEGRVVADAEVTRVRTNDEADELNRLASGEDPEPPTVDPGEDAVDAAFEQVAEGSGGEPLGEEPPAGSMFPEGGREWDHQ